MEQTVEKVPPGTKEETRDDSKFVRVSSQTYPRYDEARAAAIRIFNDLTGARLPPSAPDDLTSDSAKARIKRRADGSFDMIAYKVRKKKSEKTAKNAGE